MMYRIALASFFLTLTSYASANHLYSRQISSTSSSSPVSIHNLSKSINGPSGKGDVSGAGTLSPFGEIGLGCGITWTEGVSFGGGLTAGSSSFGLGGGFTILPEEMQIGAGIGFPERNSSANIQFSGSGDGTFELEFMASEAFVCVPSLNAEGMYVVKCTTGSGY